ncbi:hypothetical protein PR048_001073 [Dryococelus australis]|uniref:Uncharacterized protein n=1 Tax=Dryococelus australis TaxID=614101 RepID=A0ABQ9IHT9_9NEOP|nr:hypothetical protein PR048_001073 [Dryococelus australis]
MCSPGSELGQKRTAFSLATCSRQLTHSGNPCISSSQSFFKPSISVASNFSCSPSPSPSPEAQYTCTLSMPVPVSDLALDGMDARCWDGCSCSSCHTLRGERGGRVVSLLASHQGDPGSIPSRVTPDSRMWELCRTMPLVGRSSLESPASPALSFWHRSILTSITLIRSQDLDEGGGGQRKVALPLPLRAGDRGVWRQRPAHPGRTRDGRMWRRAAEGQPAHVRPRQLSGQMWRGAVQLARHLASSRCVRARTSPGAAVATATTRATGDCCGTTHAETAIVSSCLPSQPAKAAFKLYGWRKLLCHYITCITYLPVNVLSSISYLRLDDKLFTDKEKLESKVLFFSTLNKRIDVLEQMEEMQ